jgi:hypothetical protein
MSGKCVKNCDLDCHPRYQDAPWPFIAGPDHDRAVRRRAKISQAIRASWRKRKAITKPEGA